MDSTTKVRPPLHPIIWAAAIAVIAVSAVGIAALTGFIPNQTKSPEPASAVQVVPPTPAVAPPVAPMPAPVAPLPATKADEPKRVTNASKPARHANSQYKTRPSPQVSSPPPPDNQVVSAPPPPPAPPPCRDCGVVEFVRPVTHQGEGSGLGAVAGGVLGGALGHGIGQGSGRDIATIAGLVGGAMLGNKVEKTQRTKTIYELTVRFEDGSSRVFSSETEPAWRPGDKVIVLGGEIQPR